MTAMTSARALRLLHIDDSPSDQEFLRVAFGRSFPQAKITAASDGKSALRGLRALGPRVAIDGPDVILLDLKMLGQEGHAVLKELRSDAALRRIPVVVLTSSRLDEDIVRVYEAGASAYIAKPGDADGYASVAQGLHRFWTEVAILPGGPRA